MVKFQFVPKHLWQCYRAWWALALTDDQYLKAYDTTSNISKYACETIKYGAWGDGYCDNDKFLKHIKKAVDMVEAKQPGDKYTLV